MTFLEAYQTTGRVLCISTTRADGVRTATVLNYENAPNVVIYSAVLASSAFPFLAKPFHLMEKNKRGEIVRSVEYSGRWFQGGYENLALCFVSDVKRVGAVRVQEVRF